MATAVTNVIVPSVFGQYMAEQSTLTSRIIRSGIAQADSSIGALFPNSSGIIARIPFWQPIADAAANASSDTLANSATPRTLTANDQVCRRIDRNDSWRTMDLAVMLAGDDPFGALLYGNGGMQGGAMEWLNQQQQRDLVATLSGIIADNIANDSKDMVFDVGVSGTAAANAAAATDKISPTAIAGARLTLGDRGMQTPILICHSVVAYELAVQGLLQKIDSNGRVLSEFESLSTQSLNYSQALGMTIFIDDKCPAVSDGASRTLYTSYLVEPGFIRYAPLVPKVPIEFDRLPLVGDGGGADQITIRFGYVMHPTGFECTVSTASISAATLATATTWDRVWGRKNVGFVAIRSNG
jgi:hypothetical protein